MTKRDRVAIHAPLLRGYVLVRLSKSHTSPSPLSRCILNGITCTSIMDNAPTCLVCQAELIPKVSGSATPNFDRAFLACPNDKPDNRHQGAFKWTEPPKHVPHDWPSCLCGVPAQIKKWGTTYSFKCWDESPSGCKFSRGATTVPDLQHRDCVACGWVYTPEGTTECLPVSSPSASTSPMDSTPPRKIPRPNSATPTQSYIRPQDLKHKAAIPITMYETEDSYIILARHGVTGTADANAVTLNFESPRGIPPKAIVHVNELQLAHELPTPGTTNEGTEPHSYHRTIQFPRAVHPKPTKESKATYIVLTFKKESGKLVSF